MLGKKSLEVAYENEKDALNSFIQKVYALSYDDLFELQKLFNGKLPALNKV